MAHPGGWVPGVLQTGSFFTSVSLLTRNAPSDISDYLLINFTALFGLFHGYKMIQDYRVASNSKRARVSIYSGIVGTLGLAAPAYYDVYSERTDKNLELEVEMGFLLLILSTVSNISDLYKLKKELTYKAAEMKEAATARENLNPASDQEIPQGTL